MCSALAYKKQSEYFIRARNPYFYPHITITTCMELETERLLIREFKPSDHDSIHEYAGNPEVLKYMPFDFELSVVHRKENKLIGGCRINKETNIQAHIGYMINQEYWGFGYATEVAKALVAYGFSELDVHRVYATCVPDNVASLRVLEKAGLVLEGRLRESMMSQGRYCDAFLYGILQHEWKPTNP